ncbi:hypothetical protein ccbrp13_01660 [Ktedonobacteria bacterium brp13]|nr:hypothetical protein ccbrp13_01660 [Ktedonobacteria bacterium brp13]
MNRVVQPPSWAEAPFGYERSLVCSQRRKQLNSKDIRDMLAMFLDFEPKISIAQPGEELDINIITQLCGQDWG